MNDITHSTNSGQITSLMRRGAVMVVGVAIVVAGFIAASPAKAQGELKVTATSEINRTTVQVTGCYQGREARYSVTDASGKVMTDGPNGSYAVPDWDQDEDFSLVYYPPASGTYTVKILCVRDEVGGGDLEATATFTTKVLDSVMILSPEQWKGGDKVAVKVTGLVEGERVEFAFTVDNGHQPLQAWSATADSSGTAKLTITWPATEPDPAYKLTPGTYFLGASLENNAYISVRLTLAANSQWYVGSAPAGDGNSGNGSEGNGTEGNGTGGDGNGNGTGKDQGNGGGLPKTGD